MKRLTTATLLSALCALAIGCHSSPAKKAPPAQQTATRQGPLLLPGGPGLGADSDGAATPGRPGGPRRGNGDPGTAAAGDDQGWRVRRGNQQDLSPEELQARRQEMAAMRQDRRQQMIDQFDTDHDGQLSDQERQAMHLQRVTQMVDRLDGDKDGKLSRDELEAMADRSAGRWAPDFDRLDLDHDGYVTPDEMTKAMPQRGPRGGRFYGGGENGGDSGATGDSGGGNGATGDGGGGPRTPPPALQGK
ncbi:MAG TPA: hypothetical protein VHE35_19305 [Kofleriaceae bacterium]|nr:hypothetical protein [Kofleriaceae bacterium]